MRQNYLKIVLNGLFSLGLLAVTNCGNPAERALDSSTPADAFRATDGQTVDATTSDASVVQDVDTVSDAGLADTTTSDTQTAADTTTGADLPTAVDAPSSDSVVNHDSWTETDLGPDLCRGLALCSVGGWFCEGDIAVSCLPDSNDCLVETRTDCTKQPGGYCSEAGVLAGCRVNEDPCEGVGSCPSEAPQWCDGDVLRTCIADDNGCASMTGEENCANHGKVCDDSGTDPTCALASREVVSAQIQAVRDAIDSATTLPHSGSWDINNALVTYVKSTLGADSGGVVIQGEAQGPALFILHDDPASSFAVGDEISISISQVDLEQHRHVVSELSWLDYGSFDNDLSSFVQNGSTVDLVTDIEDYEFELMTVQATVTGSFNSAGSGFVDALIDTTAVVGSDNLRWRVPTALSTTLLGSRHSLVGCSVSIGPTPLWRYLSRAQPSAFDTSEVTLSCP